MSKSYDLSVLFSPTFKISDLIGKLTYWGYCRIKWAVALKAVTSGGHTVNTPEILAVAINKKEK